jgi:hypothetical protein
MRQEKGEGEGVPAGGAAFSFVGGGDPNNVGEAEGVGTPEEKGAIFMVGEKKAMFLPLRVEFSNGETRKVEFLVDTGSEVNLIRPDLVPGDCIVLPSKKYGWL